MHARLNVEQICSMEQSGNYISLRSLYHLPAILSLLAKYVKIRMSVNILPCRRKVSSVMVECFKIWIVLCALHRFALFYLMALHIAPVSIEFYPIFIQIQFLYFYCCCFSVFDFIGNILHAS